MIHFTRQSAAIAAACALLTACGGGHDGPPQLGAATGAALSGSCSDLPVRLSTLANTSLTAVTTVPAGSLTIAGQAVAAHCLVTGKMFSRTSTVDNNNY